MGRPESWNPVNRYVCAGSWLSWLFHSDLTKHRSSATRAVCGSSSLSQAPDWPCCANSKTVGMMGSVFCEAVMVVSWSPSRTESGSSSPAMFCRWGL